MKIDHTFAAERKSNILTFRLQTEKYLRETEKGRACTLQAWTKFVEAVEAVANKAPKRLANPILERHFGGLLYLYHFHRY